MREPLYESVKEAVTDIVSSIKGQIDDDTEYAIWGHSMGALLAFETYYNLLEEGVKMPVHMFFSGRKAPQEEGVRTSFYLLPEEAFLQVVYKYGGNTRELMNRPELRELFLPIFRSDFKIAETYEYEQKNQKIVCSFTVVNGTDDDSIKKSDMNLWNEHADMGCEIVSVAGGHFFITENCADTVDIINRKLSDL